MKKVLSLLLSIVLVLTLFAGCGKSTSGDGTEPAEKDDETEKIEEVKEEKPVKIIFATNETPILTTDFWAVVSERFTDANPDVIVENIAQPSANIMMRDYLKTLLAAGQFPDVMVMASPGDFVPAGALLPIPDEDMPYIADTTKGKFNGKSYVVPYKKQVGGFFYNKKIFAENNLAEPQTYQDLVELCDKLKNANITPISMGLKDGWPQLVLASLILSADLLTENPDWGLDRNAGKTTFTSPEFKKALNKYADLTKNYCNDNMAGVSYTQMMELFFTGKAAMMPMGSWLQGEEQRVKPDFETGFFPVPSDKNADNIAVWINEGLSISAKTEYPEQCKRFVEFFMTDEEWYGKFLKTEMLFPTTKKAVEYEKSSLRKEIEEKIKPMTEVENWYDMTGDAALLPGLQTYFNKMTVNIAMGEDVDKQLELFDKTFDEAKSNLEK